MGRTTWAGLRESRSMRAFRCAPAQGEQIERAVPNGPGWGNEAWETPQPPGGEGGCPGNAGFHPWRDSGGAGSALVAHMPGAGMPCAPERDQGRLWRFQGCQGMAGARGAVAERRQDGGIVPSFATAVVVSRQREHGASRSEGKYFRRVTLGRVPLNRDLIQPPIPSPVNGLPWPPLPTAPPSPSLREPFRLALARMEPKADTPASRRDNGQRRERGTPFKPAPGRSGHPTQDRDPESGPDSRARFGLARGQGLGWRLGQGISRSRGTALVDGDGRWAPG